MRVRRKHVQGRLGPLLRICLQRICGIVKMLYVYILTAGYFCLVSRHSLVACQDTTSAFCSDRD